MVWKCVPTPAKESRGYTVQALRRTTRRLLIGATLIYCIGMLALAALWALVGQRTWWLELANTFALLLFAPLLLLLPAALLIRSRWTTGAIAAALALFVALFGARFMPPATAPAAGTSLRIMMFNQLFSNERIADVVASIRSQQVDVVGLQELSKPVAEALKAELSSEYPFQALAPGNQSGLGLISRYPFQTSGTSSSVRGQRVTIQLDGKTVTILNIHLAAPYIQTHKIPRLGLPVITDYDAGSPTRQVGRLVNEVDKIVGPLVVIGDFNTGDREPRYAQLAARMHDAFRETNWGFGFTFPDHKRMGPFTFPFPLVRIDYVWSKGGVLPAAAHVECNNTGADHCFVVADLRLGTAEALNR
jgi:endonuclease/exonuclease/phosphatase (EEP) superfamily protein YafD